MQVEGLGGGGDELADGLGGERVRAVGELKHDSSDPQR